MHLSLLLIAVIGGEIVDLVNETGLVAKGGGLPIFGSRASTGSLSANGTIFSRPIRGDHSWFRGKR